MANQHRRPTDEEYQRASDVVRECARRLGYRVELDWLEAGALSAIARKVGVSRAYLSQVWSGRRAPTELFLKKVVDAGNHPA